MFAGGSEDDIAKDDEAQLELGGAPRELLGVKYDFMRSCEAIA